MDGADHLFAIILLVSGAVGFFRGFIRESIALASWLIGLWLAWHFAYIVNPWLGGALAEPGVREWTGRAVVLLLVLLFGALVGSVVSHYARRADRRPARHGRPGRRPRPRTLVGEHPVHAGSRDGRELARALRAAGGDRAVRAGHLAAR